MTGHVLRENKAYLIKKSQELPVAARLIAINSSGRMFANINHIYI